MNQKKACDIIPPPSTLRAKVGTDPARLSRQAIERANAALAALRDEFSDWVSKDIEKLKALRDEVQKSPAAPEAFSNLKVHVHDMKGLGATYGYPMVSRLSASLHRLLDAAESEPALLHLGLVNRHIEAIIAVVRDDITEASDAPSLEVAQTLESLVAERLTKESDA